MHRFFRKTASEAGLPPGTLVSPKAGEAVPSKLTLLQYDASSLVEKETDSFSQCIPQLDKNMIAWINVEGITDPSTIAAVGEAFNIHPLVLEDIMNTEQRPKVDDFDDYMFIVLKTHSPQENGSRLTVSQVSLILMPGMVLSFQEHDNDIFGPVRDRLRTDKGRIRKLGADYLAYSLLDMVVDSYFTILEQQGNRIEQVDEDLLKEASPRTLVTINSLKREITLLRRSVWPLREVINNLEKRESPLIQKSTNIYLRDVYDHTIQVIETVETSRDILSGMVDMYLSTVSNGMNQVMKVLTIIATIFIPLTFVAGIYGMNFAHMPELSWRWGYPAVLVAMAVIGIAMVVYFRKKRWL